MSATKGELLIAARLDVAVRDAVREELEVQVLPVAVAEEALPPATGRVYHGGVLLEAHLERDVARPRVAVGVQVKLDRGNIIGLHGAGKADIQGIYEAAARISVHRQLYHGHIGGARQS